MLFAREDWRRRRRATRVEGGRRAATTGGVSAATRGRGRSCPRRWRSREGVEG
jgi:hypothetical protein